MKITPNCRSHFWGCDLKNSFCNMQQDTTELIKSAANTEIKFIKECHMFLLIKAMCQKNVLNNEKMLMYSQIHVYSLQHSTHNVGKRKYHIFQTKNILERNFYLIANFHAWHEMGVMDKFHLNGSGRQDNFDRFRITPWAMNIKFLDCCNVCLQNL